MAYDDGTSEEQLDDEPLGDDEYDLSDLDGGNEDGEEQGPEDAEAQPGEEPLAEGQTSRDQPRDPATGKFLPARSAAPAGQPAHAEQRAPDGAAPTGQPDGTQQQPEEFSFRASRQAFSVPGSQVSQDWIHLPRHYEGELRQLLGDAIEHRGNFRQRLSTMQQKVDTAEKFAKSLGANSFEEAAAVYAGSKTFQQHFAELVRQGPEAIAEWLDEFSTNLPRLQAQALEDQRRQLVKLAQEGRLGPDGQPTEQGSSPQQGAESSIPQEYFPQLQQELRGVLEELRAEDPALEALRPQDLDALHRRLSRFVGQIYARSPEHLPELGVDRGDIIYDKALLRTEMQEMVQLIGPSRQEMEEAARAARSNMRGGRNPIPPTASSKGQSSGTPAVPPLPSTSEEKDAWMELPLDVQEASIQAGVRSAKRRVS